MLHSKGQCLSCLCSNFTLRSSLTTQGKHLWSVGLPDLIAAMAIMDHQSKMTQAGGSGLIFELCDIQQLHSISFGVFKEF